MRRFRLSILILLAIVWFMLILPYLLIQTTLGAEFASQILSSHSQYNIKIGQVSHSFSKPLELTFDDVSISFRDQVMLDKSSSSSHILDAEKLIVGLNQAITQWNKFDYLILQTGIIDVDQVNKAFESINTQAKKSFEVNMLRLINIDIHTHFYDERVLLEKVNGGITPFLSTNMSSYRFNLTAKNIRYDRFYFDSVLMQGFYHDKELSFTNFGGNIDQGFFISKFRILSDRSLNINQLSLNKLKLQSVFDFDKWNDLLVVFPEINIQRLSIYDSYYHQPEIWIEKFNLEVNNLHYDLTNWQIDDGKVLFNADSITLYDELITQPFVKLAFHDEVIDIEQMMANWQKGQININGYWSNDLLHLDQVVLAGVRYQLPENWLDSILDANLPTYFSNVNIAQLSIMPSLLLDTNPDFPLQLTHFEIIGQQIELIKAQKISLHEGKLLLKASAATINTVELKYPSLQLDMHNDGKGKVEFNTLVDDGVFEVSADLSLTPQWLDMNMTAYSVDSQIFSLWRLVTRPPNTTQFSAHLVGQLSPLSLHGEISVGNKIYPVN